MNHKVDHIWHVWINRRNPIGEDKPTPPSVTDPPMQSMYSWKNALQTLAWAPKAIKKAFTGSLATQHQQCSHCKPVPIEKNELRCWLGQDVTKCPILLDLQKCFKEEITTPLPDGRPSFYADVTDDDIYKVMGAVCVWHMLASEWAHERKELPTPAWVDWNEGAFFDKSDQMFWENVYSSMAQRIAEVYPSDREDEPQDQP